MTVPSASVTIIIPCYNGEGTLDKTLASVHEQTSSDWEALVIDDGSRDKSLEIAQQWAARDRRIRVLTKSNEGLSATRNLGIKESQGKWLCFLDADDLYPKQFVERMLAAAEAQSSPQPHFCGTRLITEDGKDGLGSKEAERSFGFKELAHAGAFPVHAAITPRRVFDEVGLFDVTLKGCEDWDMWVRVARAGYEFKPVQGCEVDYRMRASSMSRDFLRQCKAGLEVLHRTHRPDDRCIRTAAAYKEGCKEEHLGDISRAWTLKMFARSVVHGDRDAARSLLELAGRGTPPLPPDEFGRRLGTELFALPAGIGSFAQNWNVILELVHDFARQEVGDRASQRYSSEALFTFANSVRRRLGVRSAWPGFASSLRSAPWACVSSAVMCATQAIVRRLTKTPGQSGQSKVRSNGIIRGSIAK